MAVATLAAVALVLGSAFTAAADVEPAVVQQQMAPGTAYGVDKTVGTPEFPPSLDLCLVMDLSGSFGDDLNTIRANDNLIVKQLFDNVSAAVGDSRFCIASFVDFPLLPFGDPGYGDYPYRLELDFVSDKGSFVGAFAGLSTRSGYDGPESQYEALYQIATGDGLATGDPALDIPAGQDPAWSTDPAVTRVVAMWTDAPFHNPGDVGTPPGFPAPPPVNYPGTHGQTEVVDAMTGGPNSPIRVVGLKRLGAGGELDALAGATGGSTVESVNAAEIANAIVEGIGNLDITVTPVPVGCDPLVLSFDPATDTVESGTDATFDELITVPGDAPQGTTVTCVVQFVSDVGELLGEERIRVRILDILPPQAACREGPNPAGKVPKAGQKSPGQNEDGFYYLSAVDNVDPDPQIFLMDLGSSFVFGPFSNGTTIKYTQAPGASPSQSPMAGVVDWKLKGQGDFAMWAVDNSGNVSGRSACFVPPPPK